MNNKLAVLVCVFFILVGCESTDGTSFVTESSSTDPSSNADCVTECVATQSATAGFGLIQSAVNGYILKSESSTGYSRFGSRGSYARTFYTYDSINRTIAKAVTSDPAVTAENAPVTSTMTLTTAGMPDVDTRSNDTAGATTTHQYDSNSRLESTTRRVINDARYTLVEYDYNDSGLLVGLLASEPTNGNVNILVTYEYNAGGLLQSAKFYVLSRVQDIQFQYDRLDRLSGYSYVDSSVEFGNDSVSYTWDENNNIIQIDTFYESGTLAESRSFEYIETDDAVYNSALYEYIYRPGIH